MWIQQGREAFRRALVIAEEFVQKTEGHPEHPWYLPMRLQRDQLCSDIGKGRETQGELRREWEERPSEAALLRYLSLLGHRQDYEEMLLVCEEDPARKLLFPPSKKNLDSWQTLIHAAAGAGREDWVQLHLPPVLEVCGKGE